MKLQVKCLSPSGSSTPEYLSNRQCLCIVTRAVTKGPAWVLFGERLLPLRPEAVSAQLERSQEVDQTWEVVFGIVELRQVAPVRTVQIAALGQLL